MDKRTGQEEIEWREKTEKGTEGGRKGPTLTYLAYTSSCSRLLLLACFFLLDLFIVHFFSPLPLF